MKPKIYDTILESYSLVPPHGVARPETLNEVAADIKKNGWRGRPILAIHWEWAPRYYALTGSHRIAAAGMAEFAEIPVKVIEFKGVPKALLFWHDYEAIKYRLMHYDCELAEIFEEDIRD